MTPILGYLGAIAANGPVSLMVPSTITTAPSRITPDAPRRGSVIAYAPRMMMVSVIGLHPCNRHARGPEHEELLRAVPITLTLGLDWQVPLRQPGNCDQRCRRDFRSKQ